MIRTAAQALPTGALAREVAKLPAFLRRDLLVAWSYRVAFFSDALSLVGLMLVFFFIGKLVDPSELPAYGGVHPSYLEFVTIGIVLNAFVQVALVRMGEALRAEQMIGTLEALLATPTAAATIQLGSAAFHLVYMPLRLVLFLAFMTLAVGIDLEPSGALPSLVLLLAFLPFVWGIGLAAAAAVLVFRRGGGVIALGTLLLGLASGAFFPLTLLPAWVEEAARYNPLAIAIDGFRDALLGGTGWTGVGHDVLLLMPLSIASVAAGSALFRAALRRERRRGTLGLY
jgi:ABC-2 type transport system permease protein